MVSRNLYCTGSVPCRGGVPLATVFGAVLKVTVLHQFAIQSAIGRIADVLEEDADEFVADGFLLRAHGQCSLDKRREPREVLRIVVHTLTALPPICSQLVEVASQGQHLLGRHLKLITLVKLSTHGSRVAQPGIFVYLAFLVLAKSAEIVRGRQIAFLSACGLVIDVKLPVRALKDNRILTGTCRHLRIVLRTPCDKVAAVGGTKGRRAVVQLEH